MTGSRAEHWLFWLIAIVAGTFDVWLLIGWREINPQNLSWLKGDAAQYEIGWEFLRHEASWSFPPTWVTRLDYPTGVSVSNLDCIPLVAVLLRPFSSLLPVDFQYLGLYAVSCYVLQAYFGLRLVSLFANGDRLVTLLGAVFFVLAPILTIRLCCHFPQLTQWIILACLYYYFRSAPAEVGLRRYFIPFVVIAMLAASITPYMALIAVLFGLAALLRAYLECRAFGVADAEVSAHGGKYAMSTSVTSASCLTWASLLLVATFVSFVVFGFVVLGDSQLAGDGYPSFSLNLLSPFDSGGSGLYFKGLPAVDGAQRFEGYNYLGMGVILLLGLFIARRPEALRKLWSAPLRPLTIASIIFTLLALSVRVTFANHVLFTLPVPKFLFNLLAAFRASGRLFWPVHYLLVLAAVVGVVATVRSPAARRAILATALVIQYFDLLPQRGVVAAAALTTPANPLVAKDWQEAVTLHRHLVILPAIQCGVALSPGGLEAWPYFARLVARSEATLNSAYLGRIPPKAIALDCKTAPAQFLSGGPRRDTAYVLDDRLAALVAQRPRLSHYCRRVNGFNLCTYDPAPSRTALRRGRVFQTFAQTPGPHAKRSQS